MAERGSSGVIRRAGFRVYMRPVEQRDAEPMVAAFKPASASTLPFFTKGMPTVQEELRYITEQRMSATDYLFAIIREKDRAIIGTAGLHEYDDANRNARLGMLIFDPANRGAGYGKEAFVLIHSYAFGAFGLHKVYVRIPSASEPILAAYRRRGYVVEGVLREAYFLRGEFRDVHSLSLLERDWRGRLG